MNHNLPDGINCQSYTSCLNIKYGNEYNNATPHEPSRLPTVGSGLVIILPIVLTIIATGLYWLYENKLRQSRLNF